jgi:outer membrane lipoprotein-sorting protein
MKRIIIILFTLAIATLQAQDDKKAKDILDKLSAKTKAYSSITSEFTYSLVNKEKKINSTQSWKIKIKGDRYRLDMGEQIIYFDGKTMWKFLKSDNEVEISTPSANDEALNPKNIFTMWEKGYKYKYVNEENVSGKTAHVIDLFPSNPKEKDFTSIRLYIDKAAMQVLKSEVKGKNGNVYTYDIKKFMPNQAIEDVAFTFNMKEHPGVEVNDIR